MGIKERFYHNGQITNNMNNYSCTFTQGGTLGYWKINAILNVLVIPIVLGDSICHIQYLEAEYFTIPTGHPVSH